MTETDEVKPADGLELLSKYRVALMGFAALIILFFHEWTVIAPENSWFGWLGRFVNRRGFLGVDIFFMLSGMGLVYSIEKNSVGAFYRKRFKRILLPFLTLAVVRALWQGWSFTDFICNVSGYNFFAVNIYSFMWFVPAIAIFYLVFPWFYKLMTKSKHEGWFIILTLEVWLLLALILIHPIAEVNGRSEFYGFINRIPIFVIGVYIGWLLKNKKAINFNWLSWVVVAVMFALGVWLSYMAKNLNVYLLVPVSDCCLPNILMSISLSLLLAKFWDILSHHRGWCVVGKILTVPLAFLGTFSLELYCAEEDWIYAKLFSMVVEQWPIALIDFVFIAGSIIIGYLMYLIFKYFWKLVDLIIARFHQT